MRRTWSIGRTFVLRHAGMPFDWLEGLRAPERLLAAAERSLEAEDALRECARSLAMSVDRVEQAASAADPGALPRSRSPRWRAAADRWAEALRAYDKEFEAAEEAASDALGEILRRDEVQEAVFLSTPEVYRNMLVPFLAAPGPLNARRRRARRQLYTYVQRFCAKNETVSFFGPMGYASTVPGDGAVLRTGRPRRRRVFLAAWASRELAAAVASDRRLRTALPFRLTGLPPADPRALEALPPIGPDGATLPEIAAATGAGLRETAQHLRSLVAEGALVFGVAADPYDLEPLRAMTGRLAALPASDARTEWTGRLERVAGLLRGIERAALPERVELTGELEAAFTEATGKPARRGEGAVYADRAVFYEECSSPFALEVGEGTIRTWERRIADAMEVSTAHGWAVWSRARRLVADALPDSEPRDLTDYAALLRPPFDPGGSRFAPDHMRDYPAHDAPGTVAALLDDARALDGDRYVLVDLCPGADDVGGIGDGELVVSRCHHHLLTDGWLATMAEDRAEFAAAATAWAGGHPESAGLDLGRRNKGYYRYPGRRVVLRAPSAADAGDPGVLWPRQLTVTRAEDGPRCTGPDGTPLSLYLSLSDYVKYPPFAALSAPQVLHAPFTGAGRLPRVDIGGAVYQRARWTPDPARFTPAPPAARFLALRRFARSAGAQRYVFCRTDRERKPYLVDLESVLAADLIAHIAKGAESMTAEQMLPGPGQLWLRDEQGRRYTCELRMQLTGLATGEES